MTRCRHCGHSRWFLKLDWRGWCRRCREPFDADVRQRLRWVENRARLLDAPIPPAEQLSICQGIIRALDRLVYYEYRGWLRPEPPAADVRADLQRRHDHIRQQLDIQ